MSQKKKVSKTLLATVITVGVALLFLSALLITNIFIPVKYLSAYLNGGTDKPEKGEMRISFIDVGGSDCTLIELPDGKVALLDGGNGSYNNQLKIFKTLNSFGIDKIDFLFCTSSAEKRCGGLAEIVKYKQVDKVFAPIYKNEGATHSYRNFRKELNNKSISIVECVYGAGEYNREFNYSVCVIYPEKEAQDTGYDVVKSASVWISFGGVSLLLLGDMSASELSSFYETYFVTGFEMGALSVKLEDCTIVKPANGGKASGVYAPLYDLIKAQTAIISTNQEPDLALVSDLEAYANGNIFTTKEHGTVTVSISGGTYGVKKER